MSNLLSMVLLGSFVSSMLCFCCCLITIFCRGCLEIIIPRLAKRGFKIPASIDELIASFENPHIPKGELIAREDSEFLDFADDAKPQDVIAIKCGEVPEWLSQRYKSKFKGQKRKKENAQEKDRRLKTEEQELLTKKAATLSGANAKLQGVVKKQPGIDAPVQERRDWDLSIFDALLPLLTFPMARKKVRQYVLKRKQVSPAAAAKRVLGHKIEAEARGGKNEDTYDAIMLKKVMKKEKKKEKKLKQISIAEAKKKLATFKMMATKRKKKEAAAAAAAAAAAVTGAAAAPASAEDPMGECF